MVGREGVAEGELARARSAAILRRDFRGGVEFLVRVRADETAQQSFAASLAVGPSRVEEVAAEFDTAWAYGEGRSEALLGRLVRANPNKKLYTASKIPPKNRR